MIDLIRILAAGLLLTAALSGAASGHEGLGGLDALPQASTRGLAMGETGLTRTGEAEGFMINPSCLTSMAGNQVRAAYGTWFEDLGSSRMALIYARALGSSIYYPGEPSPGRRYGVGLALERSGLDLSQGSRWASNLLYLGLAWAPMPYLAVGFAPKMIFTSSGLESGKASGFAVDWGLRLDLTSRVSLAAAMRNMPGSATWKNGESESLPAVYAFGAGVALPYDLLAEFMLALSGAVDDRMGLGIEAPLLDSALALRLGLLWLRGSENRTTLTAGFGVDLEPLDFDYALRADDDWATGLTHRFSVRFDF
jgi:hypothetical protein